MAHNWKHRRQQALAKRRQRNQRFARRNATLALLFNVKRNRQYSPGRTNRRRLVAWFRGKDWAQKIRKLSDRQIRQAVDLNGSWNPRRLSASAREALGWNYRRNNLTGRGQLVPPTRPYNTASRVRKQKNLLRVKSRDIFNKKTFGANRLKMLQNEAYKNTANEALRDAYPDLADAISRGGMLEKSSRTLMAEARGGKGIKGRRVEKLVQEHGSWTAERTDGGEYVTLDGKNYRGNYHTFSDGAIYTGRFPTNSIRWTQVLVPSEQYEANSEIYRNIFKKVRHIDRRTGRSTGGVR
tara:strand:- start:586 stop:1473 length:888 start_codon:yes stop_codon:yes gene_type:complete